MRSSCCLYIVILLPSFRPTCSVWGWHGGGGLIDIFYMKINFIELKSNRFIKIRQSYKYYNKASCLSFICVVIIVATKCYYSAFNVQLNINIKKSKKYFDDRFSDCDSKSQKNLRNSKKKLILGIIFFPFWIWGF